MAVARRKPSLPAVAVLAGAEPKVYALFSRAGAGCPTGDDMDGWFGETAGGVLAALGWTVLALLVVAAAVAVYRKLRGQPMSFSISPRTPRHRISVVDTAVIDRQHRLVLVRRDSVEHLILIGGSRDMVVESNIPAAQPQPNPVPDVRPVERNGEQRAQQRESRPQPRPAPQRPAQQPRPQPEQTQRRTPPPERQPEIAVAPQAAPVMAAPIAQAVPSEHQPADEPQASPASPPIHMPREVTLTPPVDIATSEAFDVAPIRSSLTDKDPALVPVEEEPVARAMPEPSIDFAPQQAPSIDDAPPAHHEPRRADPMWSLSFDAEPVANLAELTPQPAREAPALDPAPEMDDALLRELELTLDTGRSDRPRPDSEPRQALHDEMDRLLGELAGERR